MLRGAVSVVEEGYLPGPGGRIWFRRVGAGERMPVLAIHGGPGAGHDYLEPLERLASAHRPVVLWDQLGCGRSEAPGDPGLYRLERLVEEIATVRAVLGLERVHLLGQSVGGWFAIEYLLEEPAGVISLNLVSTSACAATLMAGIAALRAALPADVRGALERGEASGDINADQYQAAELEFVRRHVYRRQPFPESLIRTIENTNRSPAYPVMWGRNEFLLGGSLRHWDRRADLPRLRVPTLITCGRYDKFVRACSRELHEGIAGSELHVFDESSHMSHLEETDRFLAAVGDFLDRVEEHAPPPN
jgi:proline-specific peptidase